MAKFKFTLHLGTPGIVPYYDTVHKLWLLLFVLVSLVLVVYSHIYTVHVNVTKHSFIQLKSIHLKHSQRYN